MAGNPKDAWAGVLFLAFGLAAVVLARHHHMGAAMRMGPAYFPTILGGLLAVLGGLTLARGLLRPGPPLGSFAIDKLVLVLGATALFGFLLRPAGLLVSLVLLVLVSGAASRRFRWRTALLLAGGSAAFCAVVFVKLLGLPIPVVGKWFGG